LAIYTTESVAACPPYTHGFYCAFTVYDSLRTLKLKQFVSPALSWGATWVGAGLSPLATFMAMERIN